MSKATNLEPQNVRDPTQNLYFIIRCQNSTPKSGTHVSHHFLYSEVAAASNLLLRRPRITLYHTLKSPRTPVVYSWGNVCVCVCARAWVLCVFIYTHIHLIYIKIVPIYNYIFIYTFMDVYVYMWIYMYTHMRAHTFTPICLASGFIWQCYI